MSGATLFERLALAQISGHLAPRADRITDIDRCTALGFAPRLGSYLIRLKAANDAPSYADARELIASYLYQKGLRKQWGDINRMRRIADSALHYFLFDMCKTCQGRGVLAHSYSGPAEEDAGAVCPDCGGSTKAPRNVRKRAVAICRAGEMPQRLEKMLNAADAILERSARLATGISKYKLYGRDK